MDILYENIMIEKKTPHIEIYHYESIDSTSSQLKRMIESDENTEQYTVVTAFNQCGGRGQGENRWSSSAGKNLTFSLLLHPIIDASSHFYLNMCISLGIKKALEKHIDRIKIKWPNDIYVNDSKLCGILIESTIKGTAIIRSVVGIGINIEQKEWENWVPNPISLSMCGAQNIDKDTLMREIITSIHDMLSMLLDGEKEKISALYHDVMYRKDTIALYNDINGTFEGVIQGVDEGGRLIIKDYVTGEKKFYMFKEVRYL